jgi:hypothetical protein
VIVVATEDFELYHEVVDELRDRGVTFTTVEPGEELPERTTVVITAPGEAVSSGAEQVTTTAAHARRAVEESLALLRSDGGRIIIGIDPGTSPGIAVLAGDTVVAAFQVPLAEATATVSREVADATNPLVRIGDGARLQGAQVINDLDEVPVELVDETGTTPYLGSGTRGMGDVLAAVNIARMDGERIESREIEPTSGELTKIKQESRRRSETGRTIDESLARRVAAGDLTIDEALSKHRDGSEESAGTQK